MCAPALPLALGVASFAVGTASALTQYAGQQQMASQQASYQANLSSLEQERARREQVQLQSAYNQEMFAKQLQLNQQREASARELAGVAKEARAVRSRIKVAKGEAGVQGMSIDGLLDEVTRQELGYSEAQARRQQILAQNFSIEAQNMAEAVRTNKSNALFGSQMKIASINAPIQKPSLWALGMNIAGSGLSGANTYFTNAYYANTGAYSGRTFDATGSLYE